MFNAMCIRNKYKNGLRGSTSQYLAVHRNAMDSLDIKNLTLSHPQPERLSISPKINLTKYETDYSRQAKLLETRSLNLIPEEEKATKRLDTPPHIKRIEKFLKKFVNIKARALENSISTNVLKSKPKPQKRSSKTKITSIPARYKDVACLKPPSTKSCYNLQKTIENDLLILKMNNGSEISDRVKFGKLAILQESTREGILKKQEKFYFKFSTSKTPLQKSVKFDID